MTEIVQDSPRRGTDLTGQVFGLWTVVGPGRKAGGRQLWTCRCACGTERDVLRYSLIDGSSRSCGCAIGRPDSARYRVDLTGRKFGYLTVIGRGRWSGPHQLWTCQCACGVQTDVYGRCLVAGETKSCGCAKGRIISQKITRHGLSGHPLYRIWVGMIWRCTNPTSIGWKNYGGRGISVCSEWANDVWAFFAWAVSNGYRPDLSIDRINNDGNYEPDNCRWATRSQQAQNKRPPKQRKKNTDESVPGKLDDKE